MAETEELIGEAFADRVDECLAAMAGIEDPAAFVKDALELARKVQDYSNDPAIVLWAGGFALKYRGAGTKASA